MGFYNIPIVAAFLIAIFVACLQNRKLNSALLDIIPYMFYPFLLLVSVLTFVAISPKRKKKLL